MKQAIFNSNTIWCIHSARSGEYWFVRCPSRSGAKIFLCGTLGPKVDPAKGPFESWEYPEKDIPTGVTIHQAKFFPANDPRNWKHDDESEGKIQSANAAAGSGDDTGSTQ